SSQESSATGLEGYLVQPHDESIEVFVAEFLCDRFGGLHIRDVSNPHTIQGLVRYKGLNGDVAVTHGEVFAKFVCGGLALESPDLNSVKRHNVWHWRTGT